MQETQEKELAQIEIGQVFSVVMIISVTIVGTAYMLSVMGDVKDDYITNTAFCNASHQTACGEAYNATLDGIVAVGKFPTKMKLIATIIVAVIIITLLTRYFKF